MVAVVARHNDRDDREVRLGTGPVAVTERDGLIIDRGQDSCGSCGTPEEGLGTGPVAVTERDGLIINGGQDSCGSCGTDSGQDR